MAKRYSYNADNRLVKAVTAHGVVQAEYYYDPFGRRLWKEVSGVKTYFSSLLILRVPSRVFAAKHSFMYFVIQSVNISPIRVIRVLLVFLRVSPCSFVAEHLNTPRHRGVF